MTKDSRKERMHVRDGNYMIENKADSKQSKGVPINDHPRHLSHTLGSFEPIAPHLPTPVAPFAGKSQQEIAATAAIYYGECTLQVCNVYFNLFYLVRNSMPLTFHIFNR